MFDKGIHVEAKKRIDAAEASVERIREMRRLLDRQLEAALRETREAYAWQAQVSASTSAEAG